MTDLGENNVYRRHDCGRDMHGLRIIETTSAQWLVPLRLPSVLCQAGGVGETIAATPGGDAGRNIQVSGRTWPGRGSGVRGPCADETPLSWAEVEHGQMMGVFCLNENC